MKLCKECHHFSRRFMDDGRRMVYRDICTILDDGPNPVNGGPVDWIEAFAMRMGPCGLGAKFFEPINITRADRDQLSSRDYPRAQLSAEG